MANLGSEDASAFVQGRIGKPLRVHGALAYELGSAILAGKYAPGDHLPREVEVNERFNVSKTAYREAMRILIAKGLVESRPKTGTRVSPRSNWHLADPDVLAWAFASEPSSDFLRHLFEVRMIIEPAAAALAAERRTSSHLAKMGHALEEMASFGLGSKHGQVADQRFHRSIMEATSNEVLTSLSSTIEAAVSWTTIFKQRGRAPARDPIPPHRDLYEAIADRHPEQARTAMVQLVQQGLEDTEEALNA